MTTKWKKFKVSEYITPKEAELIIKACPKERDRLILRTLWETGGRVSEALSLIPDKIDSINNCIILPNLKQAISPPLKRVFLFPESTLCHDLTTYCQKHKISDKDWVFRGRSRDGRVSAAYIWNLLVERREGRRKGLAVELGIRKIKGSELKPAWPHLFRHGNAHYILGRIGRLDVVKQQLGHSSIMTTEGYTELSDEQRQKIIQGL